MSTYQLSMTGPQIDELGAGGDKHFAAHLAMGVGLKPWIRGPFYSFGDSRSQYWTTRIKTLTSAALASALPTFVLLGVGSADIPVANGTLKYYLGTNSWTWQAPSDTEGPQVPHQPGIFTLPSGTNATWSAIVGNRSSVAPNADTSYTVAVAGNNLAANGEPDGIGTWLWPQINPLFDDIRNLGIGGMQLAELVYIKPWLIAQLKAQPGVVCVQLGTNDVSNAFDPTVTAAAATALFQDVVATHSALVIVTENARYVSGGTTPLSGPSAATLNAIVAAQVAFAATYPSQVILIDAYRLSVLPSSLVGAPYSSTLVVRDGVHYDPPFAQLLAMKIAAQINASVTPTLTSSMPQSQGDPRALPVAGVLVGTGGTASTGGTTNSQLATGFTVSRASGADATISSTAGARPDGLPGIAQILTVAGTTGNQIVQNALTGNLWPISGWTAGLTWAVIEWELLALASLVNINFIVAELQMYGPLGGSRTTVSCDNQTGLLFGGLTAAGTPLGILRSKPMLVPADISQAFAQLKIGIAAGGSGVITHGNMRLRSVSAPTTP